MVRKVSALAYELDFKTGDRDEDVQVHPVVSIQYLSRYNAEDDPFRRELPEPGPVRHEEAPEADNPPAEEEYEVERILDKKIE